MADEITPKEEAVIETPDKPFNKSQDILPISEPIETTIPSELDIPAVEPEPTLNSNMKSGTMAQIPVNEPLPTPVETPREPEAKPIAETVQTETVKKEIQPETEQEPGPETLEQKPTEIISKSNTKPIETNNAPPETPAVEDKKVEKSAIEVVTVQGLLRGMLVRARQAIQSKRRKKIDKIMTLFEKKSKITNDQVEKLLHVSDSTATRYLSVLMKEGKIIKNEKKGSGTSYSKK